MAKLHRPLLAVGGRFKPVAEPVTGLSIATGPTEPPIPQGTIGDWLDRTVALFGDAEALVIPWQKIRWSWAELDRQVDGVAAGLDALGLRTGDRVGICAPNCVEWVLAQLATARLGLVLVSINPACRTHELGHALRLTGVRALITAGRFKHSDYIGMLAELVPAITGPTPGPIFDFAYSELRHVIEIGDPDAPARLAFASLKTASAAPRPLLDPGQAINIQFTSGTTGLPKAAALSHTNLLHNAVACATAMNFTADDRLCIPVPLYHCFGMVLGVLVCVTTGAAMVFPSPGFDALEVLRMVEQERCTALHGVPTMFIAALDHPDFASFTLDSLRTGVMAGAPCPPAIMTRVMGEMHCPEITIGYGMTETSPLSTQTPKDASFATRTQTVGVMHPHCESKIVDAEGRIVPLGVTGEYCARGPGVMLGYWGQPEATAAAIQDGWIHSGDLATLDDQGRVCIVGRLKDMIIRGGENIYPAEVEAFLITHPDIAEAAVFGIPDPVLGERVCAWVRVRGDLDPADVQAWCRDRIAHHKIPTLVRVADQFPMTVTGKIQKFAMREAEAR